MFRSGCDATSAIILGAVCCLSCNDTKNTGAHAGLSTTSSHGGETTTGSGGTSGAGGSNAETNGGGAIAPTGGNEPCEPPLDATGCVHPKVEQVCGDGWCRVPAGCFVMGAPPCEWGRALRSENEMLVTLSTAFEMQQHEVTQAEWLSAGFINPSGESEDGSSRDCLEPECPVGRVTWVEALAFANSMSEKHNPPLQPCYALGDCTGTPGRDFECTQVSVNGESLYECEGYRLPTKAEWEYAARAGSRTAFYNGEISPQSGRSVCGPDPLLDEIAWYCNNANASTHPVARKTPNGWGFFDMLGNAAEFNMGPSTESLRPTSAADPEAALERDLGARALRGGWMTADNIWYRAASRMAVLVDARTPGFGFRLVRTLKE